VKLFRAARRNKKGKIWATFFSRDRIRGNVVLNYKGFPKGELAAYARAYHEAARHLVKTNASSIHRGFDACPIVFLYRHAVELYLKYVILWGNSILWLSGKREVAHKNIFTEHRLRVLLKSVQRIVSFHGRLDNYSGNRHVRNFRDAQKLVVELDEFDPLSYSFRYPVDTTGKRATLPHHFLFNVVTFGEKFDELLNVLDWMSFVVYEDFQSQAEALWESQHS
jgi:hypothetical protein